ncbi:MAG: deoxyribodipyrimidine photo-lyase [Bacteroidetes bacterium]|nr:deoxyribodipyrimidine photo-lyase [Bacteroidota bacterium]
MKQELSIFWFRRDLRLKDNAGLYYALKSGLPVLPVFIFDTNILDKLENKRDARVQFIYQELERLQQELAGYSSALEIFIGTPEKAFEHFAKNFNIKAVFANSDYEPYAVNRDLQVEAFLKGKGIEFKTFKDQVLFEKGEVAKADGLPYTIYTPYMKKVKEKLNDFYLKPYPTEKYFYNFFKHQSDFPTLKEIGFEAMEFSFPSRIANENLIKNYHLNRDYPAKDATTRLGIHLRFGTISIRGLAKKALSWNEQFMNELIWRDFFMMILHHFPHSASYSFKKKYDHIKWRNNEEEFELWCAGKTGYPMVDAGMRQLNETGFLHNRVRMVVASFLCKHLLIDWRWGEAYFAEKLLDYDLSANVGNWQWAAGSGCDAAPYFRVFNPELQKQKFDPEEKYIKKWVKEFNTAEYPKPMVEHKMARERVLKVYKEAVG